ncbi:MAG: hypothetical protein KatS3mg021_0117 [Fimbriimonadales bacterium]|nr:MAG: hypothetical protein KatS3mg021_0117 [Fimbriimonadales bacterium]
MKTTQVIRIEGGLFSADILERLQQGDLPGQKPSDFNCKNENELLNLIAALYEDARALYQRFRQEHERMPETESDTTLTRQRWVLPLLTLLEYRPEFNPESYLVEQTRYRISHRADAAPDAPPVHIVGRRQSLDRVDPHATPRRAPHALLQEFLNRTEHLWGIVTNGATLRLLRDSTYLRKLSYIEFDLDAIFEGQQFEAFVLLYRLLHRSRLPSGYADAHHCLLEQYYRLSEEQGGRIRERLRESVENAIVRLANALLQHPHNPPCAKGELPDAHTLYQHLLRLIYRILFLLVGEERGLISPSERYRNHYSISRLRPLTQRYYHDDTHEDLWYSLRVLWECLRNPNMGQRLQLDPLNGELFAPMELENWRLANRDLLDALKALFYYHDPETRATRAVNYAALDVEELGSVYESLLELHPVLDTSNPHQPRFEFLQGSERKTTGSYYTPPELVAELVEQALLPVIQQRLADKTTPEAKERALLEIRVLDPACGSGHFLLAAARQLARELARIRHENPSPEHLRHALREVIAHCLYGVDKNPLAVELCKLALWIEGHNAGKPLSFLDHHIRCGDSLVGVRDLQSLLQGIPSDAYDRPERPPSLRELKKRNELERAGQRLLGNPTHEELHHSAILMETLSREPDDTPEQVRQKHQLYQRLQHQMEPLRTACDLWVSAFFWERIDASTPTTGDVYQALENPSGLNPTMRARAATLAHQHRFFHWFLEFPEVFLAGGFDVVLGNPPWEQIQFDDREFFAASRPDIAEAPNMAKRKKMIEQLAQTDPDLYESYRKAQHANDSLKRFVHGSGRFPLTSFGRLNSAPLFTELARQIVRERGYVGVVVPTGIATDAFNQHFFADLVARGELVSLYDFDNRAKLFPAVINLMKFCLLTLERRDSGAPANRRASFAFFCHRPEELRDPRKILTLTPDEIALLNPNTRTLPIFRTRQDAELTKAIYARVPVLINEQANQNPWRVQFKLMFMMNTDSHLFRTASELEAQGFRRVGNRFVKGAEVWLPLYEAKMIWLCDHRYGTYEGVESRSSTQLPTPTDAQHADPAYLVQPWYWVPAEEVRARLEDWGSSWVLGWRKITNATNERSIVIALSPACGYGDSVCLLLAYERKTVVTCLLACLSSMPFDYIVRQKLGGVNLQFMIARQLPILPPTAYTPADLRFIVPRMLELVYTAWDMKPFADDVWRDADDSLRAAIRAQWQANAAATGGHPWQPPDWVIAYPEIETDPLRGIPLPPFRWEPERRARIRAELDAYYAKLYGLTRKQLRYILDPADLTPAELEDLLDPHEEVADPLEPQGYAARMRASDFPSETFRVLKEKELRDYGEYRTRRLILEAWERLQRVQSHHSLQEGRDEPV